MKLSGREIETMKSDVFHNITNDFYDVRRKTTTFSDGVANASFSVIETRQMDVQAIRFSAERGSTVLTIEVGGEKFVPSFRAFTDLESDVTASDQITAVSGTTKFLVLRTYDFEAHKEMDLKDIKDKD